MPRASRLINIRVSDSLWQQVRDEAGVQGETGSEFIRQAVVARLIYLSIARDGPTQWQRLHAVAHDLADRLGAS